MRGALPSGCHLATFPALLTTPRTPKTAHLTTSVTDVKCILLLQGPELGRRRRRSMNPDKIQRLSQQNSEKKQDGTMTRKFGKAHYYYDGRDGDSDK